MSNKTYQIKGSLVCCLHNDVYDYSLIVVLNANDAALKEASKRFMPNHKHDFLMNGTDGRCWWNTSKDECLIAIQRQSEERMMGTLAHELVHFLSSVCDCRGLKYDHENDEPMTYLMGWAMRGCWPTVRATFQKNRKKKK